jgi:hypothetical protein
MLFLQVWFQNMRARLRRRVRDTMYPVMSPMSPALSPVAGSVAQYGLGAAVPTFPAYLPASQVVPGHYQPYPNSPVSFYSPGYHHQFRQSPQEQTKQAVEQQSGDHLRRQSPSPPHWMSAHFPTFPYGAFLSYC